MNQIMNYIHLHKTSEAINKIQINRKENLYIKCLIELTKVDYLTHYPLIYKRKKYVLNVITFLMLNRFLLSSIWYFTKIRYKNQLNIKKKRKALDINKINDDQTTRFGD